MSLWKKLLGQQEPSSGQIAKERLQLALTVDRTRISPALLDTMKDEIINVISKYVDIDPEGVVVSLSQQRRDHLLVAQIPLDSRRRKSG
ncbi:MAG: cell division topological specificity factor MinE [Chloroflexota bacterium]